eukprot:CAMPEP_0197291696 /NCGR_PEP_ID=MMETSP0890-20130614/18279_1 /TAXON_ID=44058 ORGANISM="Aureoumbra lagunensis, Strain CCMP1510" /NCGR_SAMPLE_ID=MMETSP0890 /ASSEMBLY_ACC=CAM_ASM_000533 /LENGTH=273 /DNA_ID=CAMNT_0042764975 /DNA_START=33 /DNA_END=851 /DNA_ORIENTATION=-
MTTAAAATGLTFGPITLSSSQIHKIFSLTYCAELSPLLPGHVILAPKRQVARLIDLNDEEFDELCAAIRLVQNDAPAFNIAMKDGSAAGQPIPHCHFHVIPRTPGDLPRNDDIYEMLDAWAPKNVAASSIRLQVPEDSTRETRTPVDMANEATMYATLLDWKPTDNEQFFFGKFKIDSSQVFYATPLTYTLVNLKPLVPGHVLVIPRRIVSNVRSLTDAENHDLWRCARHIERFIIKHYSASAANLAIQDGVAAGQSVPHVHIHILPRSSISS